MNLRGSRGGVDAAGLVLLIVLAAITGCARKTAESRSAANPTAVLVSASDVAQAAARDMASGISFTGELQPAEIVEIVAHFDGDLEKVLVREGQAVRLGQSLAIYRPRDVKDALQAADAEYLAAQAGLIAAENGERRAQRLLDAGAASPSDLEAAKAQRTAAEAGLRAAEARRNRATEDQERLDVPSPITGSVAKVLVHSGDRTAVGDRLFTVVDTNTLELNATVPSEALNRVRPGSPIRFRLDSFPGEVFDGKVDRVNPTTEPGTRQVRIYMRLPNPDGRLVGGLFAIGRVIDSTRSQVTAAPLAVLRQEGTEQVVYAVRNGTAKRIAITTGLVDEDAGVVELLGDVSPGDLLLTGVLPGLKDGVPIKILESGSGGATSGNSPAATDGKK
jgi:membrane fusion protein, multidrug efflux system